MQAEDSLSLRSRFLRETEQWIFPVTGWEKVVAAAVLSLGAVPVERLEESRLAELGMEAKECHRNARRYVERNSSRDIERVVGWWRLPRLLVLHSVVKEGGQYHCVTPAPDAPSRKFCFIPDPAIEWRLVNGNKVAHRNGKPIGIGIRLSPDEDYTWFTEVAARLKTDMDPWEALALPHPADLRKLAS